MFLFHAGEQNVSKSDIYDKLTNLVKTNFVQRCPHIKDITANIPVPQFEIEENLLYRVPTMETEGKIKSVPVRITSVEYY